MNAQWAKTTASGTSASISSDLKGVSVRSDGVVSAVAAMVGTVAFGGGTSVTVASTANSATAWYYSSGTVSGARKSSGTSCDLVGVAADGSANTYVVGTITGTMACDLYVGTVTGTSSGYNAVVAKYDSSATSGWAKTVTIGPSDSIDLGCGCGWKRQRVRCRTHHRKRALRLRQQRHRAGQTPTGDSAVLVKYNTSGTAQWTKVVTSSGATFSDYFVVAVDASGNLYAAGSIYGNLLYDFGDSKTASGAYAGGDNEVVVKYNSSGTVQWVKTVSTGTASSYFYGVAVDTIGDVYAAGSLEGTGTFTFGTSVTAAGPSGSYNGVLVRYDSAGVAQWASIAISGSTSDFFGVAIDATGTVCVAGRFNGGTALSFGSGVSAAGTGYLPLLVGFRSSGSPQFARTISAGTSGCFNAVATDSSALYVVGNISGTGSYDFGNSITATGLSTSNNVVIVKYSY